MYVSCAQVIMFLIAFLPSLESKIHYPPYCLCVLDEGSQNLNSKVLTYCFAPFQRLGSCCLRLTTKRRLFILLLVGCHARSWLLLRCVREIRGLISRSRTGTRGGSRFGTLGRGWAAGTANVVLSLGGVVASVGLRRLIGAGGMMTSQILDLSGLGVDYVRRVFEMMVDEPFVAHVDEWPEVDQGDCDKGKAPDRGELDEPV